jgi:hypothetical protein
MVLIGDSHAAMWAESVASIAQANGYSILLLIEGNCQLSVLGKGVAYLPGVITSPQCLQWRSNAIQRVSQFQPSFLLVSAFPFDEVKSSTGRPVPKSEVAASWFRFFKQLGAPNRKVVVIGDIPTPAQDPPYCLAAHESRVQACSTPVSQAITPWHDTAQSDAAQELGDSYVNVIPWLCTKSQCPAIIGNFEVYLNQTHITTTYANQLSGVLATAIGLLPPPT